MGRRRPAHELPEHPTKMADRSKAHIHADIADRPGALLQEFRRPADAAAPQELVKGDPDLLPEHAAEMKLAHAGFLRHAVQGKVIAQVQVHKPDRPCEAPVGH